MTRINCKQGLLAINKDPSVLLSGSCAEGDKCISESFIVQELGWSHNRTYKAHPFDFSTGIFLSTLQKDPDITKYWMKVLIALWWKVISMQISAGNHLMTNLHIHLTICVGILFHRKFLNTKIVDMLELIGGLLFHDYPWLLMPFTQLIFISFI